MMMHRLSCPWASVSDAAATVGLHWARPDRMWRTEVPSRPVGHRPSPWRRSWRGADEAGRQSKLAVNQSAVGAVPGPDGRVLTRTFCEGLGMACEEPGNDGVVGDNATLRVQLRPPARAEQEPLRLRGYPRKSRLGSPPPPSLGCDRLLRRYTPEADRVWGPSFARPSATGHRGPPLRRWLRSNRTALKA